MCFSNDLVPIVYILLSRLITLYRDFAPHQRHPEPYDSSRRCILFVGRVSFAIFIALSLVW